MDDILNILTRDGRATPASIAAMTGACETDVRAAIEKYERDGTILRYRAVLNSERIAETTGRVRAWIEVNITPQRALGFDAIAERIYKFPEVKNCYLLSGGYDLLLLVECDSLREVGSFVSEKLAPMDNVTRTATHFLLKVYKENDDIVHLAESGKKLAVSP